MTILALNADLNLIAPLKHGPWKLSDIDDVPKNGLKVFSCFHCGGGSTMGYKLAGFDVLGGVEIDPEMMGIYRANHKPKHSYLMGVQEFRNIPDSELPEDIFNLDILDGSPPCSSFSMAGSREKAWGKKKKFREGQVEQVLDDLFFDFIAIAKKLKPKVVVAENVKGLIQGNARGYVKEIFAGFKDAGYHCQLFLLNAAYMGVPQRRERTVFVANKLGKNLALSFGEPPISVQQAFESMPIQIGTPLTEFTRNLWVRAFPGESMAKYNNGNGFNNIKFPWTQPAPTVASSGGKYHPIQPRKFSELEYFRLQSFPDDFYTSSIGAEYICGMSVPPFMMQRIAIEIHKQMFDGVKLG